MPTPILDLPGFKSRSIMPPADVDSLVRARFLKQASDLAAALTVAATITASSVDNSYTRTVGSFLADGFGPTVGLPLVVSGFVNGSNNGAKVVVSVTATKIIVSGAALTNEGPIAVAMSWSQVTPETKFGDVVATGNLAWVQLTAAAALAASGVTNYATITVSKRTNGGPPVTIAQIDTTVTALPAGVPVAVPLVGAAPITAEDVLTIAITKSGTGATVPPFQLDARPTPNFVELAISRNTAHLYSRLAKRYVVPLGTPTPEAALRWLTYLVTRDCYSRRGFNPGSEQDQAAILGMADLAEAQMKEAADSDVGLFDLPTLDAIPSATAIAQGGPYGYAEASPYSWIGVQSGLARVEDESSITQGLGNGAETV